MIALAKPIPGTAEDHSPWPISAYLPPGHISMREAIRRARNSDHYHGSRERKAVWSWCYRLAKQSVGSVPSPVMCDGQVFVHPSIHEAFSEPAQPDRIPNEIRALPAGKRNRAMAKLGAIRAFEKYMKGHGRVLGRSAARKKFIELYAEHFSYRDGSKTRRLAISARSLVRWESRRDSGGIDALAKDGRGGWSTEGPVLEAAALYWSIRSDPRRFSIAHCWRLVASEAKRNRWRWFQSLNTCKAWDRRTRDNRMLTLNQRGDLAYAQRSGPWIEPDLESYDAGECWVGDDATLDVWVRMPNGKMIRPAISAWLCWRSRVVTGFRIVRTGTENSILAAFSDGARSFGLPAHVIVDNGKNYSSYAWTGGKAKRRVHQRGNEFTEQAEGVFALCDVQPSWALPYNPNAKARLERWFRTLHDFCKVFPSYCGGSADDRPERHAKLVEKAVEWDEFRKGVGEFVQAYNDRPHLGEGMEGRTPLQVMSLAPRKRVVPEGVHDLLLATWHRPISIGRNGVTIKVAGKSLRYGARRPEILNLPIGTKIRVGYDADDLRSVVVWTMDYRFVCRADLNKQFNRKIPDEALRETMRQDARHKRKLREVRKGGFDHFRDPVARTVAAIAEDATRRRLPDPKPPGGGPDLAPVGTPIEVPVRELARLRKAVGAEQVGEMDERLHEFLERSTDAPQTSEAPSGFDALRQWAKRHGH